MERRRLRLFHAVPDASAEAQGVERVRLPGRCLAISDTRDGSAALSWSLALLEAAAQAGLRAPILFTGFERAPDLPTPVLSRAHALASRVEAHGLSAASAGRIGGALSPELREAPFWLSVGTPALVFWEPSLRVLITHGQSPSAWPASLRGLRHEIGLVLTHPRGELARHLAHSLANPHSA